MKAQALECSTFVLTKNRPKHLQMMEHIQSFVGGGDPKLKRKTLISITHVQ